MAEMENPTNESAAGTPASPAGGRTKDEVALELMRFITLQTGYGKSPQSSAVSPESPARIRRRSTRKRCLSCSCAAGRW